jgi:hypothetical protein
MIAYVDVLMGHPKLLMLGLPVVGPEYDGMLKERYGIEVRRRGCIVDDELIAYAKGYNGTIRAAAKRKFGSDVLRWDANKPNR